jgi:hypothetical protein
MVQPVANLEKERLLWCAFCRYIFLSRFVNGWIKEIWQAEHVEHHLPPLFLKFWVKKSVFCTALHG